LTLIQKAGAFCPGYPRCYVQEFAVRSAFMALFCHLKRDVQMIVHNVTIGKQTKDQSPQGERKKIYVGCAESDIRYRDMMVNFRQRWSFYTNSSFDFFTSDRSGSELHAWKQIVEETIRESDGVMIIVSERTASDSDAIWEIDCALSNSIPIVGVDIRKDPDSNIPKKLVGKMTRYGWEWFAEFIDGL
jgi:hypothetical protein